MQKKSKKKYGNPSHHSRTEKNSDTARTATVSGQSKINADKAGDASGVPYFTVDIAERCRQTQSAAQANDINPMVDLSSDAQLKLYRVQGTAIDLLLKSYNAMIELAAVRLECKLSNTRVSGVAKELRELIKVMSVYDC